MDDYKALIKSLRWLSYMFPETHPAKDDTDRISNNIHLYCEAAANAIESLQADLNNALNSVENLINESDKHSWNSAKDLPTEDGDYLVCYEEGYREDYGFDEIGIAPFEVDCEGFGVWYENFDPASLGSLGTEWSPISVTHWMPLPDPPKED